VAGSIPGKTRTLALAIFQANQTGRDDKALALAGITAGLAFVALWAVEMVSRRRDPRAEP
jgi:molybdate transport system permease protein